MLRARIFDDRRCFLGESPRWDVEGSRVVWIDVLAGRILDRALDGGRRSSTTAGGRVGGIVLRSRQRGYLIGQERSIRLVDRDGSVAQTLVERVPGDGPNLRTNECAVDPSGRLLFGTMSGNKVEGDSALWRLEPSGELKLLRDGLTISNGMGWIPDGSAMYHVDSPTQQVVRLPYGDGGCGEPEVVATIEEEAGVPDGLSVDTDGGFWVACNGGGQCRHFDAHGTETHRIDLPTKKVSSCVLVEGTTGPQLFMTTGAAGMSEQDMLEQLGAGFLFVADVPHTPCPPPLYPG